LNQFLYAEYPTHRPFVTKLENQKAEQTPESLSDLWSMSEDEAIAKARELVEIGFFVERGTTEEPTLGFLFFIEMRFILCKGKLKVMTSPCSNFP
jgi:hypothetical protein